MKVTIVYYSSEGGYYLDTPVDLTEPEIKLLEAEIEKYNERARQIFSGEASDEHYEDLEDKHIYFEIANGRGYQYYDFLGRNGAKYPRAYYYSREQHFGLWREDENDDFPENANDYLIAPDLIDTMFEAKYSMEQWTLTIHHEMLPMTRTIINTLAVQNL